jgi:ADP-ribose pyrophosphatase YjhB (NUDIX family)
MVRFEGDVHVRTCHSYFRQRLTRHHLALWIPLDRINVLVEDETQPSQERRFLVFEQSKYALEGRLSMAIVGGIIEPDEDAAVAARREVAEEMRGMHCVTFHSLGRFRTDVNRGMGWVNSFLATNCSRSPMKKQGYYSGTHVEEVGAADTERQDMKSITLRELREAATKGQFLEVQWSNTVSLALLHSELMA